MCVAALGSPVGEKMEEFVKAGEIAGAVTVVADKAGILDLATAGFSDSESQKPMPEDALFWIASMSKPVTGTAVMMMVEEGKISVDEPVSTYLPEFKDLKNAAGERVEITLRHCLTHTGGLSELTPEEDSTIQTLDELAKIVAKKPAQFPAGEKWQYSQTGINVAARVVEVASGKNFSDFLQERLFDPLGMKDTGFYPDMELQKRLATSFKKGADGKLEATPVRNFDMEGLAARKTYPRGNGGLFSTAPDYSKFLHMILNGGELDGKRYLKEESVRKMTSVQSGDVVTGFTPGNGWGLGWCVVRQPQGVSEKLSPGSFGHGGAYGTQAWLDPVKGRIYLLMVQRADFPNADDSTVRKAFQEIGAALPAKQ